MRFLKIGLASLVASGLVVGGAIAAAPPQDRPGMMTQAHVWVENRSPSEAIPITVLNTPRVDVGSMPAIALAPDTTVSTRAARQQWDYRTVVMTLGADPATAIEPLGSDGWEAVGVLPSGAGSRTVVLLKRPH
jgi:hypothetical protein